MNLTHVKDAVYRRRQNTIRVATNDESRGMGPGFSPSEKLNFGRLIMKFQTSIGGGLAAAALLLTAPAAALALDVKQSPVKHKKTTIKSDYMKYPANAIAISKLRAVLMTICPCPRCAQQQHRN